ncbi:gp032 [Erwinia phage vB_EamP-S6]|uniref:Gp032 n=1 Tax=Erwinia phage vB_EamP-S6 TaxID=1051675 RepID=G0YQC4_9CAUD|nr:gp032 [Erwinia phage vB_EamP-S6]AEJ81551.1 gp032 [Erwinia phage vB_EamP-S6]
MAGEPKIFHALMDDLWADGALRTLSEARIMLIGTDKTLASLCKNYRG